MSTEELKLEFSSGSLVVPVPGDSGEVICCQPFTFTADHDGFDVWAGSISVRPPDAAPFKKEITPATLGMVTRTSISPEDAKKVVGYILGKTWHFIGSQHYEGLSYMSGSVVDADGKTLKAFCALVVLDCLGTTSACKCPSIHARDAATKRELEQWCSEGSGPPVGFSDFLASLHKEEHYSACGFKCWYSFCPEACCSPGG